MMRFAETVPGRPLYALVICLAFSVPLSKSAVSVLMTVLCVALTVRIAVSPEFRTAVKQRLLQPLTAPFLLFLGISLIGVLYTVKTADGLAIVGKVVTLPLVYLSITMVLETAKTDRGPGVNGDALLYAFIAGIFLLDIIAFLTYLGIIGHKPQTLPLAPLHVHHIWFSNLNAVGVYAALSVLLFGHREQRTGHKLFLIVYCLLSGLSILLSLSRTAWLGCVVTGIVMALLMMPRRKFVVPAVAAALIALGVFSAYSPLVRDRIDEGIREIQHYKAGQSAMGSSMGERFTMWKAAATMFLSSPLFGVGTGDYQSTMERYAAEGTVPGGILKYNQPHNMYLFSMATTGTLGLAALLFIFVRAMTHAARSIRHVGPARQYGFLALATAVHFLIAGFFDSLFNIFILRYSFAFLMGLCVRNTLVFSHKNDKSLTPV